MLAAILAAGWMAAGAFAAIPTEPAGPAYAQLETISAERGRWTDVPVSGRTAPTPTPAADRVPDPPSAASMPHEIPPPGRKVKPASKSRIGQPIGFSVGFVIAESPALAVMQVPFVGEPLGAVLFVALLPLALVFGGIGWLIGRILS